MSLFLLGAGATAAAGLCGLGYAVSRAPRLRASGDLSLHQLAEGVFVYRGYFSNSAVFVMKRGVVVVDTQVSPLAAERLRAEIARVTSLPIRYVVNTHYHGDHAGGNAAFPEAELIGSAETARFVVERDSERVEYADTFGLAFAEVHPAVPPSRTFEGALDLDVDGELLQLRQLGRVETPDACVAFWPARQVVACGDGIATHHYPYLGVPFLDEGLRDDGSWLGYLAAVKAMQPSVLIAGHGPALSGAGAIAARIDLLSSLMGDLLGSVREELLRGTPVPELVERVDRRLAHYRRRSDLQEHTVSQRFAIYRCINNLDASRKGKGWWHDLRPSVIVRAPAASAEAELASCSSSGAVTARASSVPAPLAIAMLELWTEHHPSDGAALALLSDVLFEGARTIPVKVDATEYIGAAARVARRALSIDASLPLALLTIGCAEVFGGMVLAQPMAPGIDKLTRAVASGVLTFRQRLRAQFFLGRAHQLEDRGADSDRAYREMLPALVRFAFPLLRERIRAYP